MTKNPELKLPDVDLGAPGVVEGTCEFCKGRYWIMPMEGQVAHSLPYCGEFAALEPLDFVIKNNEIKRERRPKA